MDRVDFETNELTLVRRIDLPTEPWRIAQEYWRYDGIDEQGRPTWEVARTTDIDTAGLGSASEVAGAGGVATFRDSTCPRCGGPLTLTSRTGFANALRGQPDRCRICTSNFESRVARVTDPATAAKREARAALEAERREAEDAREQARTAELERRSALESQRREAIVATYSTGAGEWIVEPDKLTVQQRLTTLTLIQRFLRDRRIGPVDDFDERFAGTSALDLDLIVDVVGAAVEHDSGASPTSAYLWEADEGEAAAALEGRYYPRRILMRLHGYGYLPPQETYDATASRLFEHLQPAEMRRREQLDLAEVARNVLAHAALGYFEFRLGAMGFPPVPAEHRDRATRVLAAAADDLNLGLLYRAADAAARSAASLSKTHPRMPWDRATTAAVNRLEASLTEWVQPGANLLAPYRVDWNFGLSALTRTLFQFVLMADPMLSSVRELERSWAPPIDDRLRIACDGGIPDGPAVVDEFWAHRDEWTGVQLRAGIEDLATHTWTVCAYGCAHDFLPGAARRVLDGWSKLAHRLGDEAAADAVLLLASQLNRDGNPEVRVGDLFVAELARELHIGAGGESMR